MKKTTKNIYIKQDAWGAYGVTNNGEWIAKSLNFDKALELAKAITPTKTIVVKADWGTMTYKA